MKAEGVETMKVTDAFQDYIVVRFGDHTHVFTVEQLALLIRQAYWRLDYRNASYLARIIADALVEPPPEANSETWQVHHNSGINSELRKKIKEHNPAMKRPHTKEDETGTDEEQELTVSTGNTMTLSTLFSEDLERGRQQREGQGQSIEPPE